MHFTIAKNRHYPYNWLKRAIKSLVSFKVWRTECSFRFTLGKNCEYQLDSDGDGLQWNKLAGFSGFFVHRHSTRVGWRTNQTITELCLYIYRRGQRTIEPFPYPIKVNQTYEVTIVELGDETQMVVKGISDELFGTKDLKISNTPAITPRITFDRYFYFGGKTASPHKMTALIDFI